MSQPKPYIPRSWQLPHLLATSAGGKVLIVERCEPQPPPCHGFARECNHEWGIYLDRPHAGPYKHIGKCPLGPISTVLSIEGVGDFRTTAIDLRRVDSMTEEEALLWLGDDGTLKEANVGRLEYTMRKTWLTDNPGATWGDWAWFITAERIDNNGK